jgi:hypothetical protein
VKRSGCTKRVPKGPLPPELVLLFFQGSSKLDREKNPGEKIDKNLLKMQWIVMVKILITPNLKTIGSRPTYRGPLILKSLRPKFGNNSILKGNISDDGES